MAQIGKLLTPTISNRIDNSRFAPTKAKANITDVSPAGRTSKMENQNKEERVEVGPGSQ